MPCYKPLQGWRSRRLTPNGKRGIVFKESQGYSDMPVTVACGQCIGCRLQRSLMWAVRCVHEAQLHEYNCFITLTYDDEHLPMHNTLVKEHFQKFMKRLRKKYTPKNPFSKTNQKEAWKEYHKKNAIKYYHCGEYGEHTSRPHYHACIFNFQFKDLELWSERDGVCLYVSEELNDLWGLGYATVGDVTFESAAYTARYIMKKVNGDNAESHYQRLDLRTGELYMVETEYTTMSNGIGKEWFKKYKGDCYPKDFVTVRGVKNTVPKYYDGLYEIDEPEEMEKIKALRVKRSKEDENNTVERLRIREAVKKAAIKLLKRDLE